LLRVLIAAVLSVAALEGQAFFPLSEVAAGQRGIGKTVFSGAQVEEFEVEILGVLENVGPRQSLILGKLSGGPLARTGVMAGMSGSPVYIDGRLAGAVAFSFPFATEPLAGIRPIEEMTAGVQPASLAQASAPDLVQLRNQGVRLAALASPAVDGLRPIASPVSFGGFSERTLEVFGDQLRSLGLRPVQGLGGGSSVQSGPVVPGAMISVGLIRGDLHATAAGTVTHVEGDQLYAFGRAFMQSGPAELPLMKASVITLVPSVENSFKLAASGELAGKVTLDRSSGIVGRLGEGPSMVPLSIRIGGASPQEFQMELARDRFLTPFLLQLATFSALDVAQRQLGPSAVRVSGQAHLSEGESIELSDVYSAVSGATFQAAAGTAAPVAFILQSAAGDLALDRIDLEVEPVVGLLETAVLDAWADRSQVRPGETVELTVLLRDSSGEERTETRSFTVPGFQQPGDLRATFSDSLRLNILDFPLLMESEKLSAAALVSMVNSLRAADGLYLRIWSAAPSYRTAGERLASPPASLRVLLGAGGADLEPTSTLEETVVLRGPGVVRGQAEIQFTVIQ